MPATLSLRNIFIHARFRQDFSVHSCVVQSVAFHSKRISAEIGVAQNVSFFLFPILSRKPPRPKRHFVLRPKIWTKTYIPRRKAEQDKMQIASIGHSSFDLKWMTRKLEYFVYRVFEIGFRDLFSQRRNISCR